MKVCVPTIGVCGTSARNYGIGANYFLFFTGNDSVRVKLQENGSYSITHIDDLKYFLKKISQYFSSVCFVFIVSYFRERASWEILCKICVSTV